MVVGSGDRVLAYAAYGRPDSAIAVTKMNACHSAHYRRWAEPFHDSVRGNVGAVAGRLFHLWHGEVEHRHYRERHEAFAEHPFDPATDLVRNTHGVYEWAAHRRHLAEVCRSYLASRFEDGAQASETREVAVARRAPSPVDL
jgi:hypothetical protein